jgi:hypothetical protein
MTGRKEMIEMLSNVATKSNADDSREMRAIQVLAVGLTHCLRSLDGIEAAQKKILDQRN